MDIEKKIVKAQRELDQLVKRFEECQQQAEQLKQQMRADKEAGLKLKQEIDFLTIRRLEGVPNGVVIRFKGRTGERVENLNNLTGTVVSIARTKAVVDFGNAGKWRWSVLELLPAERKQEQGYEMPYGFK